MVLVRVAESRNLLDGVYRCWRVSRYVLSRPVVLNQLGEIDSAAKVQRYAVGVRLESVARDLAAAGGRAQQPAVPRDYKE